MNSEEELTPIFASYFVKRCKKLDKQGVKRDDILLDGGCDLHYKSLNHLNIKCLCVLYQNKRLRNLVSQYLQLKYKINSSYTHERKGVDEGEHHLVLIWSSL